MFFLATQSRNARYNQLSGANPDFQMLPIATGVTRYRADGIKNVQVIIAQVFINCFEFWDLKRGQYFCTSTVFT